MTTPKSLPLYYTKKLDRTYGALWPTVFGALPRWMLALKPVNGWAYASYCFGRVYVFETYWPEGLEPKLENPLGAPEGYIAIGRLKLNRLPLKHPLIQSNHLLSSEA